MMKQYSVPGRKIILAAQRLVLINNEYSTIVFLEIRVDLLNKFHFIIARQVDIDTLIIFALVSSNLTFEKTSPDLGAILLLLSTIDWIHRSIMAVNIRIIIISLLLPSPFRGIYGYRRFQTIWTGV
jgi:hypothetical protein